ncbi:MAG: sulfatase [Planctomycetaceae bacterium]
MMPAFATAKNCVRVTLSLGLLMAGAMTGNAAEDAKPVGPNIVLILADDLGYGDLSCFGSQTIRTPNIDAIAEQGTRFTQFYVTQAVCSASRASLMTGCYANRVGMEGALNHTSPQGIHPDEWLLPEMLKQRGYATAIFGKWHLGLSPYFSPLRNGFDEYLGIPYSNDNTKYHPSLASEMPPLPLYDGDEIVETDPDQSQFTRRFTDRAVKFIHNHQDKPFFLYVPHVMPHVPIFASDDFRGRSAHGLYADVVEEIDWSVGQILAAIDDAGVRDNTLVIFASDNGPFLSYGTHAGTTGGLREGKLTVYEGGVRVPCVMRWPAKIAADRVSDQPLMTIDLLPTIARWIDSPLPTKPIDGKDISECLFSTGQSQSPHDSMLFYSGSELQAVRSGSWKLHLPHSYITVDGEPGRDGKPAGYGRLKPKSITLSGVAGIASRHGYRIEQQPLALYDLSQDAEEAKDVSAANPEVVKRLLAIADTARRTLGDSLTGAAGSEVRACGNRLEPGAEGRAVFK